MFVTSDAIIALIEKETAGLQVVAVRSWLWPVEKQRINYRLSILRDMNLLEEFVMKTASLALSVPVTIDFVAELLGLDQIFIESCVAELAARQIIQKDRLPVLVLTELGQSVLGLQQLPEDTVRESIEYYFDRKFGGIYSEIMSGESGAAGLVGPGGLVGQDGQAFAPYRHYAVIEQKVADQKKFINRDFLKKVSKLKGVVLDQPKLGRMLSGIDSAQSLGQCHTLMSEFWVYDIVENQLLCQGWDHAGQVFQPEIASFIQNTPVLSIPKTCLAGDWPDIAQVLPGLFDAVRTGPSLVVQIVRIVRGGEIRLALAEAFAKASRQVVMAWPLASESDSDIEVSLVSQLQDLAERNVQILIVLGSGRGQRSMDPSLFAKISQKLLGITNRQGLPMVCLLAPGINLASGITIEKEIAIDEKLLIVGSFDWLDWHAVPKDYHAVGALLYVIEQPDVAFERSANWQEIAVESLVTGIFQTADPLQMLAELNFLHGHLQPDRYQDLVSDLVFDLCSRQCREHLQHYVNFCQVKNLDVACAEAIGELPVLVPGTKT
jgi:hypothetical protein